MIPNVECALGKHVAVQNAMRIGFEQALTTRLLELGADGFASADERAEWSTKMEILSGGRNVIRWVNDGDATPKYWPSIMVRFPNMRIKDLLAGSDTQDPHQAFTVGSKVQRFVEVCKYPGTVVVSNAKTIAISVFGVDCAAGGGTSSPLVGSGTATPTFNNSLTYCANGGTGFHLMTAAEWALVALLSKKRGYQCKGNNYYGRDADDPDSAGYYGIPSYYSSDKIGRVQTGSGPLSWMHDGTPWGVWGLNGNVYEWLAGLRQAAGEIQIIPNNDAAADGADLSRDSASWKAIAASDGSLMDPEVTFTSDTSDGTDAATGATCRLSPAAASGSTTLTVDTSVANNTTGSDSVYGDFDDVDVDGTNVVAMPEILKSLAVVPGTAGANSHGGDRLYARLPAADTGNSYVETMALRGGFWSSSGYAGVFILVLSGRRSSSSNFIGFRPAFVENL